jgi:hypothetical protein
VGSEALIELWGMTVCGLSLAGLAWAFSIWRRGKR